MKTVDSNSTFAHACMHASECVCVCASVWFWCWMYLYAHLFVLSLCSHSRHFVLMNFVLFDHEKCKLQCLNCVRWLNFNKTRRIYSSYVNSWVRNKKKERKKGKHKRKHINHLKINFILKLWRNFNRHTIQYRRACVRRLLLLSRFIDNSNYKVSIDNNNSSNIYEQKCTRACVCVSVWTQSSSGRQTRILFGLFSYRNESIENSIELQLNKWLNEWINKQNKSTSTLSYIINTQAVPYPNSSGIKT